MPGAGGAVQKRPTSGRGVGSELAYAPLLFPLWGTVSARKAGNQSWLWAALCPSGHEAEPTTQPQDTHCHLLGQFPASEFSSPPAQTATLPLRAILTWGGMVSGRPSPTWQAPPLELQPLHIFPDKPGPEVHTGTLPASPANLTGVQPMLQPATPPPSGDKCPLHGSMLQYESAGLWLGLRSPSSCSDIHLLFSILAHCFHPQAQGAQISQ